MMEDLDAAGVAEEDTTGKAKRRLEAGRRLVFGNARARVAVLLAVADLLVAIVFALLPDTRVESSTANSDQRFAAVFITQVTLSWLNVAIGTVLLGVLWVTYSVPKRRVTFERLGYLWYVVVGKMAQMLSDVALLGYPNPIRLIVVVANFLLCLLQVVWNLRSVRLSRELFTRKLRPPLVIKALLDMKGDTLSAADPLTLGMLERLEGIVKVREQMKFNVKHGRCAAAAQFGAQFGAQFCGAILRNSSDATSSLPSNNLTIATMLLLVFSFLSFSWEFTKILTYQSRFFSRTQVEQIDLRSNLFMYWPSRAYESLNGYTGNGSFWRYNIGAADACEGCEMPRTTTNARPRPVPNGDQRVVLVVVGGLSAEPECADDPPRSHALTARPCLPPPTSHRPPS